MDRIRMKVKQDCPFGRQFLEAVSQSMSQARRSRNYKLLLFVDRTGGRLYLRDFMLTLARVQQDSRNFYPLFDDLMTTLHGGAKSMLVVFERGDLHILCSPEATEFDELLYYADGVVTILEEFEAPSSRFTISNLSG